MDSMTDAAENMTFLGTQPTLTHVPPVVGVFSINATDLPYDAARRAELTPPASSGSSSSSNNNKGENKHETGSRRSKGVSDWVQRWREEE